MNEVNAEKTGCICEAIMTAKAKMEHGKKE